MEYKRWENRILKDKNERPQTVLPLEKGELEGDQLQNCGD